MRLLRLIGSFIFWTYDRGSWQYDVMCAIILAFIFLTPARVFKDRPVLTEANQVVQVTGVEGSGYRVEAKLLQTSSTSLEVNAEALLKQVTGRPVEIQRIQPVVDDRGRIEAYTIWIKEQD